MQYVPNRKTSISYSLICTSVGIKWMFRKTKEIHAITSPFLLILKKTSKDRRISMNFLKLHVTVTLSQTWPVLGRGGGSASTKCSADSVSNIWTGKVPDSDWTRYPIESISLIELSGSRYRIFFSPQVKQSAIIIINMEYTRCFTSCPATLDLGNTRKISKLRWTIP